MIFSEKSHRMEQFHTKIKREKEFGPLRVSVHRHLVREKREGQ